MLCLVKYEDEILGHDNELGRLCLIMNHVLSNLNEVNLEV